MVFIPFIYFTILTLWIRLRHGGWDVASFLTAVYAFSALFSIIAFSMGDWNLNGLCPQHNPSALATFAYCTLLTITFIPFIRMNNRAICSIPLEKSKAVDILSWGLIFTFITTLVYLFTDIQEVLSGDLRVVRDLVYADVERETPSGYKYILALPATLFSQYSPIAIFLFYYNICFRSKSIGFNLLLLLSSLTPILLAILIAGRTQPVYWVFNFILGFVFFSPYMHRKQKLWISIPSLTIIILLLIFMTAVTISRFGDINAFAAVCNYAGQPFLNFCYFFDVYRDNFFSLQRLFPFTDYFIMRNHFDLFAYRDTIMAETGLNIGIFYTFLGDLMIDLTHIGMVVYILLYCAFSIFFLQRPQPDTMPFYQLFIFLILVLIPLQGLFYYSYYKVDTAYFYIGSSLLACFFKYRYRI